MIDLHMHTTASDGQYTPSELVTKIKQKGISVFAITDHDTVKGLEEGKKAAQKENLIFIPGIEITIERPFCEFHLLGLGLKRISNSLTEVITSLQNNRHERNLRIVQHMNDAGYKATLEEIQNDYPGQTLGRPHFAFWMEKRGIVKHHQQAFDKFLARGRPWFEEHSGANLDEAIVAINESGGIPVLAHPMSLYLSWSKMETAFIDFRERGIQGIEAFHPGARVTECLRLEEMARKLGFFVTAGSDFHGEKIRHDRKPGHTCGDKIIEDRFYFEELVPALNRIEN